MQLDVVFCTYNSSKWIKQCIESILESDFDLNKISLIFYDNCSNDDTINILLSEQDKHKRKFNDFIVKQGTKNRGFGYGNNRAVELGKSDYIFIFNIDTQVFSDTFKKIEWELNKSEDNVGIWELAQRPYEHPKFYNPINGYTSWSSGACMIIKRNIYQQIGGFDEEIFMYAEDVEISWHVRLLGYKLKYLYDIPIIHYSYNEANEFKYTQYAYGFISNFYLRAKYGTFKNFCRGGILLLRAFKGAYITPENFKLHKCNIRKLIAQTIFFKSWKYLLINIFKKRNNIKVSKFINILDYEIAKEGPFYQKPNNDPKDLISIIIDNTERLDISNLITSLENQTYKNLEIIELKSFKDYNNLTIKGNYLIFCRPNVLFFPDCLETFSKEMCICREKILFSSSFNCEKDEKSSCILPCSITNLDSIKNSYKFADLNCFMFDRALFGVNLNDESDNFISKLNKFWKAESIKNVGYTTSLIYNTLHKN